MAVRVFAVALAIRLLHVWLIKDSPFFDVLMGDARGYDEWAQRIAAGDWLGSEVFYQAPLYPYFLGTLYSIFGRDLLIVRIAQAIVGSASCAFLAMAGSGLLNRKAGWIAGLGLAFWAPAIFFDGILQKSVLDMFFVCLSLWLLSDRRWLPLGLAMGALALTRENAMVFIVVIAIWILIREKRALVTFAVGLMVVLLPVAVRNYSVGGGFYLTTSQFGTNFYIGNNPQSDGTYASIRYGRGSPEFERLDATEVAEKALNRRLTPGEVSSYWTDQALAFARSQPGAWLRLMGRKAMLLVNRSEMIDTESLESYAEWSWPVRLLAPVTNFGVLIPLAVLGAIGLWPERQRLWVIYAMLIAYAATVVLFYVFARYRYPLVPFLLLFAAAPSDSGATRSARRTLAQGWPAILAVAIVANIPMLSADTMRAVTENNLGTALHEAKRYVDAIPHYERAIALKPDYAPAHNNLGAALRGAGRLTEAVTAYQRAIELKPDFADASYNLANVLLERGDTGGSVEQFRRAIDREPGSVQAHNNLGIALAQKGDRDGAMAEYRKALALDDRSVQAHRNLGNMLIETGARAEGMQHLERAVALNDAEAVYDIGEALLREGNFAGAAARFESALKIKPDWAEAENNLGIALANQNKITEALTWFERAVSHRPDFGEARANRDQARAALRK